MDATFGMDGDLLFEDQPAIHSSGAPSVKSPVQHRRGAPVRRKAARRLISNGDAGQGAEFFIHFAAALLELRRLVDVNGSGLRSRWDSRDRPPGQFHPL